MGLLCAQNSEFARLRPENMPQLDETRDIFCWCIY